MVGAQPRPQPPPRVTTTQHRSFRTSSRSQERARDTIFPGHGLGYPASDKSPPSRTIEDDRDEELSIRIPSDTLAGRTLAIERRQDKLTDLRAT